MEFEEPITGYFSNSINIPLIDHVRPMLDLLDMSKQLVCSIGGQKHKPKTQKSHSMECLTLKDQCLQNAR